MRPLARFLDYPVHNRLEQPACGLRRWAEHLARRLEEIRAGAIAWPIETDQTGESVTMDASGTAFRSCETAVLMDLTGEASLPVHVPTLVAALVGRLQSMTGLDTTRHQLDQIQVPEKRGNFRKESLPRLLYAASLEPGTSLALEDLIDLPGAVLEQCGDTPQLVCNSPPESN